MAPTDIPPVILKYLTEIEPGAEFSGRLPRILSSSGKAYYAKLGSSAEREQWEGEAESLKAMHGAAPGIAPRLFAFGAVDKAGNENEFSDFASRPFFLSEYRDFASLTSNSGALLGERLASEMHAFESPHGFGFGVPTYCGATRFENGWFETWAECFDAMIGQMLGYLNDRGRFAQLRAKGDQVRKRVIPNLLGSLNIRPVLLHGDLWSGNTGTERATGQPVIFDPASYYGHNEADLGIARMFGGIPQSFFKAYHEYMPKSEPADQYDLRVELYQMFHYLNHTVLFGGGYASTAEFKMDNLLRACP